jgi:hypothetical protein
MTTTKHAEPLSPHNCTARLVRRNDRGRIVTERDLAIPAGITYADALNYAKQWLGHREEIAQFDKWEWVD